MRPSPWFCLLALALVVGVLRVSLSVAGPRQPAPPSMSFAGNGLHPTVEPSPSWLADGYGLTVKDATDVAEKNAQASLVEYLNRNYGNLDWRPVTDSLKYLREQGVLKVEEPSEDQQVAQGRADHYVRVRVELTPRYVQEVQTLARDQRMQQRQLLLARVLAGLVVLLVVVAGYLRLEDATRGYYTSLLRLSAIGLLVVVAVGLLVIG